MSVGITPKQSGLTRRSLLKWSAAAAGVGALSWSGWLTSGRANEIKIAAVSDFSAPPFSALTRDMMDGFRLALEQAGNSAGGRGFQIIEADEQNVPARGVEVTKKVIEQDKADFIIGPISSAVAAGMRDVIAASNTVWMISNAGNIELTGERCARNIFRTSFSSWQTAYPFGPWAFQNVSQSCFLAYANYAFGQQTGQYFTESYTAKGGKILGQVTPPLGTSDFSAFLPAIANANPPAVFAFFSGSDAVAFVKQFAEFGLKDKIKLTGPGFLVEEDVLPAQGDAALGVRSLLFWALTLENRNNILFRAAYKAKTSREPSVFAVQGYDTANIIVDMVNRLGGKLNNLDDTIRAAETTVINNSPRGFTVRFDPATHNVILNMVVREVRKVNGQITNVVIDQLGEAIQPTFGCKLNK
ncbi:ABC transporter substrate-binding protein [Candidatus Acetothermia bacterium]|nr:ABC transporter substrate-binding protein [Candidatus Acetothermia bacterium]